MDSLGLVTHTVSRPKQRTCLNFARECRCFVPFSRQSGKIDSLRENGRVSTHSLHLLNISPHFSSIRLYFPFFASDYFRRFAKGLLKAPSDIFRRHACVGPECRFVRGHLGVVILCQFSWFPKGQSKTQKTHKTSSDTVIASHC